MTLKQAERLAELLIKRDALRAAANGSLTKYLMEAAEQALMIVIREIDDLICRI